MATPFPLNINSDDAAIAGITGSNTSFDDVDDPTNRSRIRQSGARTAINQVQMYQSPPQYNQFPSLPHLLRGPKTPQPLLHLTPGARRHESVG
jgi:hypothetical protein